MTASPVMPTPDSAISAAAYCENLNEHAMPGLVQVPVVSSPHSSTTELLANIMVVNLVPFGHTASTETRRIPSPAATREESRKKTIATPAEPSEETPSKYQYSQAVELRPDTVGHSNGVIGDVSMYTDPLTIDWSDIVLASLSLMELGTRGETRRDAFYRRSLEKECKSRK